MDQEDQVEGRVVDLASIYRLHNLKIIYRMVVQHLNLLETIKMLKIKTIIEEIILIQITAIHNQIKAQITLITMPNLFKGVNNFLILI